MKLILHSDDFGLHKEIDRGILDAAKKGILTSTSLLANGPVAEDAMEEAKSYPRLGVGVHLNIVRGRPLSDPSEIPSLVDRNGLFFNSTEKLLLRSLLGRLSPDEIYNEYRLQTLKLIKKGITPTHFDGEKHTHLLLPEAVNAVKKLMKEFAISKVRTINESPINRRLISSGISLKGRLRQKLKLMFVEYRTRKAKGLLKDFKSPDFFFGVLVGGRLQYPGSIEMALGLLELDLKGTLEWMFHIGYPADLGAPEYKKNFGTFFLSKTREEELKLLFSKEFVDKLKHNRHQLISYREL